MTVRLVIACAWLCSLALCASTLAANPGVALQHNPFTRPDLGDATTERLEPAVAASFDPELRATLVAGRESLANIAGELYSVGEEVDGYRLVRIGEGFAVFERAERQVTAYIRVPENMNQEER